MSSERTPDPLGIGAIEQRVVALAQANRCYGACINALGEAWTAEHRAKYGEAMPDPSPQAVWRRAAEKAEADLSALRAVADAAVSLGNEVAGVLGLDDGHAMREAVGNTNFACVQGRLDTLRAALARLEQRQEGRRG